MEGGPRAGGVLPGEEVVPELPVSVLAVMMHRLREIPDAPVIRPICITILYHNLLLFIDIFHI
jgi:hypothetical protein